MDSAATNPATDAPISPAPPAEDSRLRATHHVALLRQLRDAATERVRQVAQIDASCQTRVTRAETEYRQERERIEQEKGALIGTAKREFKEELVNARSAFDQGREVRDRRSRADMAKLRKDHEDAVSAHTRERTGRLRKTIETHESRTHQADIERQAIEERLDAFQRQFDAIVAEARKLLGKRRSAVELADATHSVAQTEGRVTWEQVAAAIHGAEQRLLEISRLAASRFIDEGWPVLGAILAALVAIYPAGTAWGWSNIAWPVTTLIAGGVAGVACRVIGQRIARRQTERQMPSLRADFARITHELRDIREQADRGLQRKRDQLKAWRSGEERRIETTCATAITELERRLASAESELTTVHERDHGKLKETWERATAAANTRYPPTIELLENQLTTRLDELAAIRAQQLGEAERRREKDRLRTESDWKTVLAQFESEVAAMRAYREAHFPPWDELDVTTWQPPSEPLSAIPFGTYRVRLSALVPPSMRREGDMEGEYELPAVLSVPDCPSLLLEVGDQGRDEAARVMQDVMLRWLTAVPAGKIRFTIIDPVGLGQSFSSFMHLADYDERLVNSRIWTEHDHIRQKLSDLTEQMENVIQKYLRNEYKSIQEYNREAGEVAEPVHILVVANFPEGFGDESARRLASIVASGARCGVYLLASIDTRMNLPRDFYLNELEEHAATLVSSGGGFVWKHAELQRWPLEVAKAPSSETSAAIIHAAGDRALGANRVEVPFRTVAPAEDAWWTEDSRRELSVPLGRLGATKSQSLRLGRGTSQHVLVAGKTGSGKSTLFHAMITNLALRYSPSEVELYLIDFKKGVEFKAYAEHRLPHARVIAIESEREFGLSVLERLDDELKVRGDLFRKAGAQDVAGYRESQPDAALPRIVLVIDEFQEFFVKEDRIARDAALLLDRLVRQGRAFGVHVLLGSQTLAGAYSLARSTLGQMAVRIALQCGESDAHLILSEDNTAARLLSRPGEAIYNDANGLLEGNHLFQVVWLPDRERIDYLKRLGDRALSERLAIPPCIVFEGNEPADLSSNVVLRETLRHPTPTQPLGAWLGAAVAIKPPTFVPFERQVGANLLLVGQDLEMARGILMASAAGLWATATAQASLPRFHIITSAGGEDVSREWWMTLNVAGESYPILAGPHEAMALLAPVREELERRLESPSAAHDPWFVVIENLARCRDLRRDDSDVGFGAFMESSEKRESAHQRLTRILRDGPGVGIHTILVCDSYNTYSRWLDRQSLRDFAMRVLLQMGPTDSSHFIDSPAANQLGACRAILYREQVGEFEKFRPYRPAPLDWRSL